MTEVFRKSLREANPLMVMISTPLRKGTRQPLGNFIQTFRLAVPAPRQYISTRIRLCDFYTLFQLRYFWRLWRAVSEAETAVIVRFFQAIYGLSPAKIPEQEPTDRFRLVLYKINSLQTITYRDWVNLASILTGSTASHATAPSTAMAAASTNDIFHPKWAAIKGVSAAVQAPPACPPMFIRPETTPTDSPAMSAETAQKPLCAIYKIPAPQARIIPAEAEL
jgi:hypothetical protein